MTNNLDICKLIKMVITTGINHETLVVPNEIELLIFPIILIRSPLYAQDSEIQFDHLFAKNGLANNYVTKIIQDDQGFIWIGTVEGLNRYDGYSYKVFKNDPKDSTSLSDDWVTDIYEDKQNNIWIATRRYGLNKYNKLNESFTHYRYDPDNYNSISSDTAYTIFQSKNEMIWVGAGERIKPV